MPPQGHCGHAVRASTADCLRLRQDGSAPLGRAIGALFRGGIAEWNAAIDEYLRLEAQEAEAAAKNDLSLALNAFGHTPAG